MGATLAISFQTSFGSGGCETVSGVQELSRTFSSSGMGAKSILGHSGTSSIILSSGKLRVIPCKLHRDIAGCWSPSLR